MEHNEEDGGEEYGSPNSVTFEEMEAAQTRSGKPNLAEITLDGDEIPENLRGKTVAEVLAQFSGVNKALQISENARLALANSQEALTASRTSSAPPPPPAPVPEPELNEEQLQALYDESPRKYQEYLHQQSEKRLLRTIQGAIAPVVSTSADSVLRDAKSRYADEFAAFGTEIQSFISAMPDKTALAQPGAVDELVDWMRGKHWKKFSEHLARKNGATLDDARDSMRRETPPDFSSTPQVPRSSGRRAQLDATQKEVAAAMGLSEEQYAEGLIPNTRGRRG